MMKRRAACEGGRVRSASRVHGQVAGDGSCGASPASASWAPSTGQHARAWPAWMEGVTTRRARWNPSLRGRDRVGRTVMANPSRSATQAARLDRRRAALDRRASMSPAGPASGHLRVATWNLNSLRARLEAVRRFLARAAPDVVCLQETKTAQLSELAVSTFERHGYAIAHVGGRAYNGVAVVARHPIADIRASGELDDEHLDREPRIISCLVATPAPLRVASVYVPHGRAVDHWHYEFKVGFLEALA